MMKNVILLTLSILTFFSVVLLASSDDTNRAVATLNGKTLNRESLPSQANHGHTVGYTEITSPKPTSLEERDVAVLLGWVLEKQKEEAIKAYGITISDDEVQNKIRDVLKDKNEYVDKINETLTRLPKALRAARSNPDQADRIYDQELKGYLPYGLWKLHLAANHTNEYLAKLEEHKPLAEEDIKAVEAPIRKMLLDRKLRDKIAEMTTQSTSRETAWRSWCLQQVTSADVVIHDDELKRSYEQAVKMLKTEKE